MTYTRTTTATRWQPWTYRDASWSSARNFVGYKIDALDGEIGKVDDATYDVGSSYLVLDTGPWIFGRKVMLPAGVVSEVDTVNRRVMVDRTKDQIKNAPEFDESKLDDVAYRDSLGTYYGEGGAGWYGGI
jgi:hypothetical protein